MNVIQTSNQDENIAMIQQKLYEIKILFSEGRMEEGTYLEKEKQLLDSLETLFIRKNFESIII